MHRVKLIALDMDGTLLLSDHETIPQRNIDAIRRADSLGIRVMISTGRMLEDASDFIRRYELPCMIIAANGARASDGPLPEGRIIFSSNLSPADAHAALDILLPTGFMINGFEDGVVHSAGDCRGRKYHLVYRGLIEDRYGEQTIREAADRGMMKLFAIGDGFAGDLYDPKVGPVRRRLEEELPHLQITSSGAGNVEVIAPDAGKGQTLERVAQHYGLVRENVMAMGDAGNDLSMLAYAYHSVAMGNADPEIKAVCRYETLSNDECGVAAMIERVIDAVLKEQANG